MLYLGHRDKKETVMRTKKPESAKRVLDLTGPDGNAYVVLGIAQKWAKQIGLDPDEIIAEMTKSDYEHLISTFEKYFGDYVEIWE